MALSPGARLGPYEILGLLGIGGMGDVYRARDPRLGREVAVKVLPDEVGGADRLRRFEREARAAGALNHPNVLAVHDVGTHDGRPYVVTELLEGDTLRARLGDGALPVRKAVEYSVQIARGLAAAHDKGIVHRDLKPENLFLTRDGLVKILDFGLAKVEPPGGGSEETTSAALTDPGTVMGTVGYMSPGQRRRPSGSLLARSEWYEMRSGVIGEVRAYSAYDETRNAELRGFPYRDRRYLMEQPNGPPCSNDRCRPGLGTQGALPPRALGVERLGSRTPCGRGGRTCRRGPSCSATSGTDDPRRRAFDYV